MPLYGHELSEQIDPFQAGLGFACHLVGLRFPRPRCPAADSESVRSARSASAWNWPAAACPREGYPICERSAGWACHQRDLFAHPAKPIAMGYVRPEAGRSPARTLAIDIRGQLEAARVVELPFYRRNQKGAKK